jgi:hypothetical protein
MKMLSIMLRKEKKSFRLTKKISTKKCTLFEAQHHEELIQEFRQDRNLRSHLHVPLSSRL